MEIQNHGLSAQIKVNQEIIKISKQTNISLVCTNDCHYIYKDDSKVHDIFLCIQTGKTLDDENRMRYEGEQFYIKSPKEMYDLFKDNNVANNSTFALNNACYGSLATRKHLKIVTFSK